jgi:phosphate uptake regulator
MMYWLAIRLLLSAQRDRMMADKIGLGEPSHILYYALISRYLEVIADHAENIARRAIEFKGIERKGDKQAMRDIVSLSELAHNVFLKAMGSLSEGSMTKSRGSTGNGRRWIA